MSPCSARRAPTPAPTARARVPGPQRRGDRDDGRRTRHARQPPAPRRTRGPVGGGAEPLPPRPLARAAGAAQRPEVRAVVPRPGRVRHRRDPRARRAGDRRHARPDVPSARDHRRLRGDDRRPALAVLPHRPPRRDDGPAHRRGGSLARLHRRHRAGMVARRAGSGRPGAERGDVPARLDRAEPGAPLRPPGRPDGPGGPTSAIWSSPTCCRRARRRTSVAEASDAYGAPVDVATLHRTFDV